MGEVKTKAWRVSRKTVSTALGVAGVFMAWGCSASSQQTASSPEKAADPAAAYGHAGHNFTEELNHEYSATRVYRQPLETLVAHAPMVRATSPQASDALLSSEEVGSVVVTLRESAGTCMMEGETSAWEGTLRLTLKLLRDGTVSAVSASAKGIPREVTECMMGLAGQTRFSPPPNERSVIVVPFTLSSEKSG